MPPITWKSLTSSVNPAGIASLFEGARESAEAAGENLDTISTHFKNVNEAKEKASKDINTRRASEAILGATNLNEINQVDPRGFSAVFGSNYDLDAVTSLRDTQRKKLFASADRIATEAANKKLIETGDQFAATSIYESTMKARGAMDQNIPGATQEYQKGAMQDAVLKRNFERNKTVESVLDIARNRLNEGASEADVRRMALNDPAVKDDTELRNKLKMKLVTEFEVDDLDDDQKTTQVQVAEAGKRAIQAEQDKMASKLGTIKAQIEQWVPGFNEIDPKIRRFGKGEDGIVRHGIKKFQETGVWDAVSTAWTTTKYGNSAAQAFGSMRRNLTSQSHGPAGNKVKFNDAIADTIMERVFEYAADPDFGGEIGLTPDTFEQEYEKQIGNFVAAIQLNKEANAVAAVGKENANKLSEKALADTIEFKRRMERYNRTGKNEPKPPEKDFKLTEYPDFTITIQNAFDDLAAKADARIAKDKNKNKTPEPSGDVANKRKKIAEAQGTPPYPSNLIPFQ